MNTESSKIAIACFLGGFIGALVALQIGHHFWWLGVLIGGLVGYIAYNFREIPEAARAVWEHMPERAVRRKYLAKAWEYMLLEMAELRKCLAKVWDFVVAGLFTGIILTGFVATIGICCCSLVNAFLLVISLGSVYVGNTPGSASLCLWFHLGGTAFMVASAAVWYMLEEGHKEKRARREALGILAFAPALMPIVVSLASIALAGVALWAICWGIWGIPKAAWRLGHGTFLLIHGDIRLLCMTDAMLGALIGFVAGSAVIGGVAGAVLGVINFELVSKRWLKLVPVRS